MYTARATVRAPGTRRLCHHGLVSMGDIRQVPVTELPDDFTD